MTKALSAISVLVLAACSTPDSRISKNLDFYQTLSQKEQASIQRGTAEIGFSRKMVYLALGHPDRKYQRSTANATNTVWSYTRIERRPERQSVRVPVRYVDGNGRLRRTTEIVRVSVDYEREVDRLRLEFADDKVTAIEEIR